MKRLSVSLHGHRTSVSLEPEFIDALKQLAAADGLSVAGLIQSIDDKRTTDAAGSAGGLSSALRVYVLRAAQKQGGL